MPAFALAMGKGKPKLRETEGEGAPECQYQAQPGGSNADRQARIEQVTGPGSKILDAASNWIEVWHYLRENLPKEIPYQEVAFQFVTKQGYGKNVLQRDSAALATLARAVEATRKGR